MDIQTTTELKGLRSLLGLSLADAADLLREDRQFIQNSERPRHWDVPEHYRAALLGWERHAQNLINGIVMSDNDYVITYSNDDHYRLYEPGWSGRLPLASMFLAAATRAKTELANMDPPEEITLVALAVTPYEEFRTRRDEPFPDNNTTRQMWAQFWCDSFRIAPDARKETTL